MYEEFYESLSFKDFQLITFLCLTRQKEIGIEESEKEGTADLYRKVCLMIREKK